MSDDPITQLIRYILSVARSPVGPSMYEEQEPIAYRPPETEWSQPDTTTEPPPPEPVPVEMPPDSALQKMGPDTVRQMLERRLMLAEKGGR
jgi:hypothetical protein